jgi:pimeloyl-ACP methyl ester carboxylesterase
MQELQSKPNISNASLTLQIDISGKVTDLPGQASIATDVYLPAHDLSRQQNGHTLIVLVHGGTYTRRYWDLIVPGYEKDAYSCALSLARQGNIIVAFDTLGVGESTCTLGGDQIDASLTADAIFAATNVIKEKLEAGTLTDGVTFPIAHMVVVGHSIGAYAVAVLQARYKAFQAVVIQGYCGSPFQVAGISEEMIKEVFALDAQGFQNPPRQSIHTFFHGNFFPPAEVIAADDAVATRLASKLYAETLQKQDVFSDCVRQFDVPVLITFGEDDLVINSSEEFQFYASSPSWSLFTQKGSGHCGNLASTRQRLWEVIAQFTQWSRAIS